MHGYMGNVVIFQNVCIYNSTQNLGEVLKVPTSFASIMLILCWNDAFVLIARTIKIWNAMLVVACDTWWKYPILLNAHACIYMFIHTTNICTNIQHVPH